MTVSFRHTIRLDGLFHDTSKSLVAGISGAVSNQARVKQSPTKHNRDYTHMRFAANSNSKAIICT